MRCDRGAVPRLQAPLAHAQAIYDAARFHVIRMADRRQFRDGKLLEGEGGHATSRLAGQTLPPKIRVETPTDFEGLAHEAFEVFGCRGVPAQVLDAPCSRHLSGTGFDEGPPAGSPCRSAQLHPCDDRCGLVSDLGLTTQKPHHLRHAVHGVQSIEVPRVERLQAQALGVEGGGESRHGSSEWICVIFSGRRAGCK